LIKYAINEHEVWTLINIKIWRLLSQRKYEDGQTCKETTSTLYVFYLKE